LPCNNNSLHASCFALVSLSIITTINHFLHKQLGWYGLLCKEPPPWTKMVSEC
jgi:hypothetical protein